MDGVDLLIERYRTVRQESLETLSHMQTINQWALGSIGVGVGLGLVAAPHSSIAAAVILMVLVPLLIAFGDVEMVVMAQRVVQARRFLRQLELRIAEHVADVLPDFVGWERTRAEEFSVSRSGFRFAIPATVGVALAVGPGVGGVVLATDGQWAAFVAFELLDVVGLALLAIWAVGMYSRLKQLNESDLAPGASAAALPV